jgi:hypothetical protein
MPGSVQLTGPAPGFRWVSRAGAVKAAGWAVLGVRPREGLRRERQAWNGGQGLCPTHDWLLLSPRHPEPSGVLTLLSCTCHPIARQLHFQALPPGTWGSRCDRAQLLEYLFMAAQAPRTWPALLEFHGMVLGVAQAGRGCHRVENIPPQVQSVRRNMGRTGQCPERAASCQTKVQQLMRVPGPPPSRP